MKRGWLIAALVLLVAATTHADSTRTSALAQQLGAPSLAKKTCHYVTKKVHGKKTKVKVCTKVKPKPTPTPTPTPDPVAISKWLTALGIDQSLAPSYSISADGQTLIYTDAKTHVRRLEGQLVTIGGQPQMIEGYYTQVEVDGLQMGFVMDGIEQEGYRVNFTDQEAATTQAKAYLTIVAKTNNIHFTQDNFSQVTSFIKAHNGVVDMSLTRNANTDQYDQLRRPSPLRQEVRKVSFNDPLTFRLRTNGNEQGLPLDLAGENDKYLYYAASNDIQQGFFTDTANRLTFIVHAPAPGDDILDEGHQDRVTYNIFLGMESSAEQANDNPAASYPDDWLGYFGERAGGQYQDGNTIIPQQKYVIITSNLSFQSVFLYPTRYP